MNIDIRKHIISNFKGSEIDEIKASIEASIKEKDEITFYFFSSRTKEKEEKLIFLQYLFLPFQYEVIICWENIFGLIGIDDFMRMEEIMLLS